MIEEVFSGSAQSPVAAAAAEEYGAAASRPYEYQTTANVLAQSALLFGHVPNRKSFVKTPVTNSKVAAKRKPKNQGNIMLSSNYAK